MANRNVDTQLFELHNVLARANIAARNTVAHCNKSPRKSAHPGPTNAHDMQTLCSTQFKDFSIL
jgi:hypothetical protein